MLVSMVFLWRMTLKVLLDKYMGPWDIFNLLAVMFYLCNNPGEIQQVNYFRVRQFYSVPQLRRQTSIATISATQMENETKTDSREWELDAETEYRFELDPGTSLAIKVRPTSYGMCRFCG